MLAAPHRAAPLAATACLLLVSVAFSQSSPEIISIKSMAAHEGVAGDLGIDFDAGDGSGNIEPRVQDVGTLGLPYFRVQFDAVMDSTIDGTDVTPCDGMGGATATAFVDPADSTAVLVTFDRAIDNRACYRFDLYGLPSSDFGGVIFGDDGQDTDFWVCYLEGDVDQDGLVANGDKEVINSNGPLPVSVGSVADGARSDLDRNGSIASQDWTVVNTSINLGRTTLLNQVATCAEPGTCCAEMCCDEGEYCCDGLCVTAEAASQEPDCLRTIRVNRDLVCPYGQVCDGRDWEHAFRYLQDALEYAELPNSNVVEIWIKGENATFDVYRPDEGANQTPGDPDATFVIPNGVRLLGGFTGSGSQRGTDPYQTTLSGDIYGAGVNSYSVVTILDGNNRTGLDNLRVGYGVDDRLPDPSGELGHGRGGGVFISGGDPVLSNCTFQSNTSRISGGAIHLVDSGAQFDQCSFISNSTYGSGGALSIVASTNGIASPVFENCTFDGNGASMTVPSGYARDDNDGFGGAIYSSVEELSFNNCGIGFANASFRDGGAVHLSDGSASMEFCNIGSNQANVNGGAISLLNSHLKIRSSILVGNRAAFPDRAVGDGGAIYIGEGSDVDIENCHFGEKDAGNLAHNGGAVAQVSDGISRFVNCTFFDNAATQGQNGSTGGLWSHDPDTATAVIANCIIWGNYDSDYDSFNDTTGDQELAQLNYTSSVTHNCIQGLNVLSGDGNIGQDPKFDTVLHISSPYIAFHNIHSPLGVNSPCINAGINSQVSTESDVVGNPRILACQVDMGWVEWFATSNGTADFTSNCCPVGQKPCANPTFCCPDGTFCCGDGECCEAGEAPCNETCEDSGCAQTTIDSRGADFVIGFLDNPRDLHHDGSSFEDDPVLEIQLLSESAQQVSIEFGNSEPTQNLLLQPNEQTVVRISSSKKNWISGEVGTNAIRVRASDPEAEIACHFVNRAHATSDSAMALPTDALGTEFLVVLPETENVLGENHPRTSPTQLLIIADSDSTTVKIWPSCGTVNTSGAYQDSCRPADATPIVINLNENEGYYLESCYEMSIPAENLVGSRIIASKPVQVVAGVKIARIWREFRTSDHVFETELPIDTWGKNYIAPSLPKKVDSGAIVNVPTFYRILASKPNTRVFVNQFFIGEIESPGEFLDYVYYETSPDPSTGAYPNHDLAISADKPVSVLQLMASFDFPGVYVGDPSIGTLIATDQYASSHMFSTAGDIDGHYVNHFIVATVRTDELEAGLFELIDTNGCQLIDSNGIRNVCLGQEGLGDALVREVGNTGYSTVKLEIAPGAYRSRSEVGHVVIVLGYSTTDSEDESFCYDSDFRSCFDSYLHPASAMFHQFNPPTDDNPPICDDGMNFGCVVTQGTPSYLTCLAADNRPSEDDNGNGILDPGEDDNLNGDIDVDSGIASVELSEDAENLELEILTPSFHAGIGIVEYTIKLDGSGPPSGSVIVTDRACNTCEQTLEFESPEALIDVYGWAGDDFDYSSTISTADECSIVLLDSYASFDNLWSNPGLTREWDLSTPIDFSPAEAVGIDLEVAWTSVGPDSTDVEFGLRVTNSERNSDVELATFTVNDLGPTDVIVTGPTALRTGQQGCFRVDWQTPCDTIENVEWGYDLDISTGGVANENLEHCFAWDIPGIYEVGVRIGDSDGDVLEDLHALSVEVLAGPAELQPKSLSVAIETRLHGYIPVADSNGIRHFAQMRAVNISDTSLHEPIYLAFENLSSNAVVEDALTGAAEPPTAPHLQLPIPGGAQTLGAGEATDWLDVVWTIEQNEEEAFSVDLIPYAKQQSPVFRASPVATATEGELYAVTLIADDPEGDAIYYALVSGPSGMNLDGYTGQLSWRPAQTAWMTNNGSVDVTVRALDGYPDSYDEMTFGINIINVRVPPVIESKPPTVVMAGEPYTYRLRATDADNDYVCLIAPESEPEANWTYTLVSTGTVTSCSTTPGVGEWDISWDPTVYSPLDYEVVVGVQPFFPLNEQDIATQVYDLAVTSCAPDDQVTISPIGSPPELASEGFPYHRQVLAVNSSGLELYYSLEKAPPGMSIGDEGLITWKPLFTDAGKHIVRVLVSTIEGEIDECSAVETFEVTVENRNGAPEIDEIDNLQAMEGESFVANVIASDPDNDRLRYALVKNPPGMSIDPILGRITWSPGQTAEADCASTDGLCDVHVLVSDPQNYFDELTETIVVEPVNIAPEFISYPGRSAIVGIEYTYHVTARDLDDPSGTSLTFALADAPNGMDFDTNGTTGPTSVIKWTPGPQDVLSSPVRVEVTVTDGLHVVPWIYHINVFTPAPPLNDPPIINRESAPLTAFLLTGTNGLYSYQVDATDPEGAELTYALYYEPDTGIEAPMISSTGLIEWTVTEENVGKLYWFTVIVSDPLGEFDWMIYSLNVYGDSPTIPPSIVSTHVQQVEFGESYFYEVIGVDPDLNSNGFLDYELVLAPEGGPGGPLVAPPAGMTIKDNDDGENPDIDRFRAQIEWTPTEDQVGTHWIAIQVTDGQGGNSGDYFFNINVTQGGMNHPPEITSVPLQEATVDVEYTYQVLILDEDPGDIHLFDLEEGPSGASLDPASGLLSWTPARIHVGSQWITIRVTDSAGADDWERFNIITTTAGNSAPVITTDLPSPFVRTTNVSAPFVHEFVFIDVDENGPWSALLQGMPPGMLLNVDTEDPQSKSFRMVWPEGSLLNGTFPMRFQVTDADGAFDEQEFTLVASDLGTNGSPVIRSSLPERVQMGVAYTWEVIADDPQDRVNGPRCEGCTYTLESHPAGATIESSSGVINWMPLDSQRTGNTFVVRVTDALGAWDEKTFLVTASSDAENHAPQITSTPVAEAQLGALYEYPVRVLDQDTQDTHTYTVISGPSGMYFAGGQLGLLTWDTDAQAETSYPVVIRVTDSRGARDEQSFFVTVSSDGLNRQPVISSLPVTVATVGSAYAYHVQGSDPEDNQNLLWSLTNRPPSMTIDSNGLVEWPSPTAMNPSEVVVVRATDSAGAYAEQRYTLVVSDPGGSATNNDAPQITSEPILQVVAGREYVYPVSAFDPDTPLAFTLSSTNGVLASGNPVTWPTSPGDELDSPYDVTLEVADSIGAKSSQEFQIDVISNAPPVITSGPSTSAIVGVTYTYDVIAYDADDSDLEYALIDYDGGGASMDQAGHMTWTPSSVGTFDFEASAEDDSGLTAVQLFTVNVVSIEEGDVHPPDISLVVDEQNVDTDGEVTIYVQVFEDVAIQSNGVTLSIVLPDGSPDQTYTNYVLPVNADGRTVDFAFAYDVPTSGAYRVNVFAKDSTYDAEDPSSFALATADFLVPETGGANEAPVAKLTSPRGDVRDLAQGTAQQNPIRDKTVIYGKAYDDDGNFYKYELAYRMVGEAEPVTFATGYQPVGSDTTDGVLGEIDPTLMVNGLYEIRVTAWDLAGQQTVSDVFYYSIDGNKKVGNFTMSFQDFSIPVSGIPISVVRTYDSRIKTEGELGVGWKLELSTLALQETMHPGIAWAAEGGGETGTDCLLVGAQSHSVTIAWPDGRTEIFEIRPTALPAGYATGLGCLPTEIISLDFVRTTPGTSTLELGDGEFLPASWDPPSGLIGSFGSSTDDVELWTPRRLKLTAADGSVYRFESDPSSADGRRYRITEIVDLNGNFVQFDKHGATHSSGLGINLVRNENDRVRRVVGPGQVEVVYEYDEAGDMTRVIDPEGNATTFRYNSKHELLDVIDPRGITVARNVYDDDGRLIETVDADGHRITYEHDITGNKETITDRLGVASVYDYDDFGNITRETRDRDGLALTTTYEYDADGRNLTKTTFPETDPANPGQDLSTETTYDAFDNVVHERDINGNETTYTYNQYQQVLTITAPGNRVTSYEYDDRGNLTKITSPDNAITEFTPDSRGHVGDSTNPLNKTSSQTYDENGFLLTSTDVLGNVTTFTNDIYGRQIASSRTRMRPAWHPDFENAEMDTIITQTFYDDLGRVARSVDPFGNETLTTYNGIGKQATVTNFTGTTAFEYDSRGNLTRTDYPDGSFTETRYDAEGRRIASKDRDDNWTWFEYDRLGRSVRTYVPKYEDGEPTPPCGDFPCSWSGQTADRRFTSTEYDGMGRAYIQHDERGNATTTIFEHNKRTVRDADNNETQYFYDNSGQLTHTVDAKGYDTYFEYDADGRQVKTTFDDGTYTQVEYDKAGRKTAQIDAGSKRTEFEYDDAGRLTAVVDAAQGRTEYEYDESGNRILQRDAEGRETKMAYDIAGRMVARTLPSGDLTETFTYDIVGNMIAHTDFNGDTTGFEYDYYTNRMIKKILPETTFGADWNGQLVNSNGVGSGVFVDATIDFDFTSNPDGTPGNVTISGEHNLAQPYTVSIAHPVESAELLSSTEAQDETFEFTWSGLSSSDITALEAGELAIRIEKDGNTFETHFVGRSPIVEFDYTTGGQRTQAGGESFAYDERGRLIEETKTTGDSLEYTYADDSSNTRTLTLRHVPDDGTAHTTSSVSYRYDNLNRLQKVSDDGGARYTEYTYDAVGNRKEVVYPNRMKAVYAYDVLNRLSTLTNKQGENSSGGGEGGDGGGIFGQPPAGGTPQTLSRFDYTVSSAGNRTHVEENLGDAASARRVDYGYDDLYRLTRETIWEKNAADEFVIARRIAYTYDKVGNRERMTVTHDDLDTNEPCVTESLTTYDYDVNDRLTSSTTTVTPLSPVAQARFNDYYAGRPKGWTRWAVLAFASVSLAAFFAPLLMPYGRRLGRHIRRKRALNGCPILERSGRVGDGKGATDAPVLGKRARRKRTGAACIAAFLIPLMAVDPQTVDALTTEALRAQAAIAAGIPLDCEEQPTTTVTYGYDANGNQTTRTTQRDGNTTVETFVFDVENRLVGYRKSENGSQLHGASASYTYDADGVRTSKTTNSQTTLYTTDKNRPYAQVLEEREAKTGDLIVRYTYGDDLISQTRPQSGGPGTTRYYHYDGQMSTRHLTDDSTIATSVATTDRYTYDAFGNDLGNNGTTANAYRYTGEQFDEAVGQYYLRARCYDQSVGRFTARDPFGGIFRDPSTFHKYIYALDSPTFLVDPGGRFPGVLSGVTLGSVFRVTRAKLLLSVLAVVAFAAWFFNSGQKTDIRTEPYRSMILSSAQRNRISPVLLAAIIAAEQSDLNYKDWLGDEPGAQFGRNTSIGLGQIRVSTAIEHNLVDSSERSTVIERLHDPARNIEAAARLIRIIADLGATKAEEVDRTHLFGVDLQAYALDADAWDYSKDWTIILIGSEYTSAPWDWEINSDGRATTPRIFDAWGRTVLRFYRRFDQDGVFR